MKTTCKLCRQQPAIKNSHVIPAFVYRALKADSPTGYFRNPYAPNLRVQDGEKLPLICRTCEQRFGDAETEFSTGLFVPFHERDETHVTYGPWLHYFLTSLAWRCLVLDLPGLDADRSNPRAATTALAVSLEIMREYLLGGPELGKSIAHHLFLCGRTDVASAALAQPNVMTRRSAFGYTVIDQDTGHCGVFHNLAGVMCFLIVTPNPRDRWAGTYIDPSGGHLSPPQHVDSWLAYQLMSCLDRFPKMMQEMTLKQQEKILKSSRNEVASLRFWSLDQARADL